MQSKMIFVVNINQSKNPEVNMVWYITFFLHLLTFHWRDETRSESILEFRALLYTKGTADPVCWTLPIMSHAPSTEIGGRQFKNNFHLFSLWMFQNQMYSGNYGIGFGGQKILWGYDPDGTPTYGKWANWHSTSDGQYLASSDAQIQAAGTSWRYTIHIR